jgi:hypothetical protein
MTGKMSPYPTTMTLSRELVAQLRSEKATVALKTQRFWSYEDLIRALLLHWQAMPPAAFPTAEDLLITVNPEDKNVLSPVETPA